MGSGGARTRSVPNPVLDADTRDALPVVAPIPRDHRGLVSYGDRSDEEIRVRETLSLALEKRLGLAEDLGRGLAEPEDRQRGKEARHERSVLLGRLGLGRA